MTDNYTPMTLDTAIQWMEHGAATSGSDPWARLARTVLPVVKRHSPRPLGTAAPDRPGEPEGLNAWLAANNYRLITVEMLAGYLKLEDALLARQHTPRRDDDVAKWLKCYRDAHPPGYSAWQILDDLLDEYRLHADTGTPLHQEVSER